MELERRELETELEMERVSNKREQLKRQRKLESVQSELEQKMHSMEVVSALIDVNQQEPMCGPFEL